MASTAMMAIILMTAMHSVGWIGLILTVVLLGGATLSTGTAKRLWYVMCTTGKFDVVVLDEPFNAVDEESTRMMVSDINEWRKESLVLLVAHAMPNGLTVDQTLSLPRGGG